MALRFHGVQLALVLEPMTGIVEEKQAAPIGLLPMGHTPTSRSAILRVCFATDCVAKPFLQRKGQPSDGYYATSLNERKELLVLQPAELGTPSCIRDTRTKLSYVWIARERALVIG